MFFETNNFSVCSISAFTLNWGTKIETSGTRPYHALSFRIKGDAKFITETDTITVKTGDIVFVPAFYNYTLDSGDEEVCVIHFSSNEKLPLKIKKFSPKYIREQIESQPELSFISYTEDDKIIIDEKSFIQIKNIIL